MNDLILHHYDFSPFAEKIRLILAFKRLPWRSVIIPSFMPKPDLVALTGGYRHTPVLQIGADVFCDTRLIAREIERRFPEPSLFPSATRGLATAVEAWADRDLFWPIARYASGINADSLDRRLHADRAALRGKGTPSADRLKTIAQRSVGAMRAEIASVDDILADGRTYVLSAGPGLADFAIYHGLWFLSALPIDCSAELEPYPRIRAWMARIRAIGAGAREELDSKAALAIAAAATPEAAPDPDLHDPSLPAGSRAAVRPEGYEAPEVQGEVFHLGRDRISLSRLSAELGRTTVHFPRTGYLVKQVDEVLA